MKLLATFSLLLSLSMMGCSSYQGSAPDSNMSQKKACCAAKKSDCGCAMCDKKMKKKKSCCKGNPHSCSYKKDKK